MPQPYVGEIRMFAGNFAPAGWMFCNGQLLPISDYAVLFNLIGTTYGGDGQSTFALPDLRGRVPIHQGGVFPLAQMGGAETVTLTASQLPIHGHPLLASTTSATLNTPTGNVTGQVGATQIYREVAPTHPFSNLAVTSVGSSQPHENLQPYMALSFIISLFGIFPSQT